MTTIHKEVLPGSTRITAVAVEAASPAIAVNNQRPVLIVEGIYPSALPQSAK
jgi:hypothetical protein